MKWLISKLVVRYPPTHPAANLDPLTEESRTLELPALWIDLSLSAIDPARNSLRAAVADSPGDGDPLKDSLRLPPDPVDDTDDGPRRKTALWRGVTELAERFPPE